MRGDGVAHSVENQAQAVIVFKAKCKYVRIFQDRRLTTSDDYREVSRV